MTKYRVRKKDYGYKVWWIVSGGDLRRAKRFSSFVAAQQWLREHTYIKLEFSKC